MKELHDVGLLLLIRQSDDELENYLLLLNPSLLTNKVHEKIFSNSAVKKLRSSICPHFANMGMLPESYLDGIGSFQSTLLKFNSNAVEEFNHAEVGLDYSVMSGDTADCNFLHYANWTVREAVGPLIQRLHSVLDGMLNARRHLTTYYLFVFCMYC